MAAAEKKKNKKIWLYVFYGALTVGILFFFLSLNDLGEIFRVLKTADFKYVLLAILFALVYLALYPLTLCFLSKSEKTGVKSADVYSIGMTEHFFNGITPFATGGQPFQAYALSKKKVPVSVSTGLLIMNFLIFMAATNTYALVSLVYFGSFVKTIAMTVIAIVGFAMNFIVFVFIFLLGTSDRLRVLIVKLMTALSKIKFLGKFLRDKIPAFNEYTLNTQNAFKRLKADKKTAVLCYFTRLVTMFFYYALTFFIIKALGVNVGYNSLFYVICASSFAITTVVFMPTPGSSGGIEFAFSSIFSALAAGASDAVSYGGMLLWRLITYYMPMLISLAFYLAFEIRTAAEKKRAATSRGGFMTEKRENGADCEKTANDSADYKKTANDGAGADCSEKTRADCADTKEKTEERKADNALKAENSEDKDRL